MKNQLILFFFVLISLVSYGQNTRYDTIRYARKHYDKRVKLFEREPVRKGRIIFLGNSITEFGNWKKLLADSTVINRGIAADNTFGVLDRLDDVLIRQPHKLFIKIGINDIAQGIPSSIIVKNIITIVTRVKNKSPLTKIYVHSILPTNDNAKNEYPDVFNKNELVSRINEQIKQASASGFTYIDLNKELSDKNGKLDTKYADPDGLHLNEVGYKIWIRLLKAKKYL
jgi:lysophospholipase L1-like esterase